MDNSDRLLEAKAQQLHSLAEPLLRQRAEATARRKALQEEEGIALAQLLEVGRRSPPAKSEDSGGNPHHPLQ